MPSGYTNQNQPFSDVVNTREKKKSKTARIVVPVVVSVLIISLCVVGYTVIMNVIKNNKFNKGIGEFTGADDSAAVSSVSMDLTKTRIAFTLKTMTELLQSQALTPWITTMILRMKL